MKHDAEKYNKLLKFINENRARLEILNRYTLATKCGEAIAKGEFSRAADILKSVLQSNYDEVIHEAYGNSSQNFGTILNFANYVYNEDGNKALLLYQELFEQSKSTANSDSFLQMATFISTCYNYSDWTNLKTKVLDQMIQSKTAEMANVTNDTSNDQKFRDSSYNFFSQVYSLDHDAGFTLFTNIIQQLYKKIGTLSLIDFVSNNTNLPLSIHGLFVVNKLLQTNNYDDFFTFVQYIKKVYERSNFQPDEQEKVVKLIQKLPFSIQAAAYTDTFCIQNKLSGNFLKVFNNAGTWNVYLSPGGTAYKSTKWVLKKFQFFYIMSQRSFFPEWYIESKLNVESQRNFQIWVTFEVDLINNFVYLNSAGLGYVTDSEGMMSFDKQPSEFSQWILQRC
ncbi:uncharacterized protein LOC113385209 [Ctenocephalides felis]|uniref:uncharacterized protein LOC113385209 n=1 Tax=Ctenocephalides felis TaxID=7515 RepID=UPI000E6E4DB5|nr:uncharacterized protein LOC113385209 [Ctenocephalides felis]